jgi:hypothetical protein
VCGQVIVAVVVAPGMRAPSRDLELAGLHRHRARAAMISIDCVVSSIVIVSLPSVLTMIFLEPALSSNRSWCPPAS